MTLGVLLTLISFTGLIFALYEVGQSYGSSKSAANLHNGRRIVARYLLFKSIMYSLVLLDFTMIGAVLLYLEIASLAPTVEIGIRSMTTQPLAILGALLFVVVVIGQTVNRVRLEREYGDVLIRSPENQHLNELAEDTNRRVKDTNEKVTDMHARGDSVG